MGRPLALCAGILVLATLVPAAWSQEAPPPEDPLAHALTVVRSPDSAKLLDLQDARQYLVDQRQAARPAVVQLLDSGDALVRMNAAIILSGMAWAGDTSPATLQALQTAAKDKNLAVAYWGFRGLLSDGAPAADRRAAIREMMKMECPRALRLTALTVIGEQKPNLAAPILVSHLQEILKEYKAQVETLVTSAPPATPAAGGVPVPVPSRQPAPGERFPSPGSRFGMPMPSRPFAPGEPGIPQPAEIVQVRRADLPTMTLGQLQTLAQSVEDLPIVAEVHEMGLVLEDIVANTSPDAPLFDFKTTAPWDLDKCVDKAVIYMNAHRAEYGAAPEAPKPPAPTPAVPPAAPPTTRTAPATTAAAPALTTPAP